MLRGTGEGKAWGPPSLTPRPCTSPLAHQHHTQALILSGPYQHRSLAVLHLPTAYRHRTRCASFNVLNASTAPSTVPPLPSRPPTTHPSGPSPSSPVAPSLTS